MVMMGTEVLHQVKEVPQKSSLRSDFALDALEQALYDRRIEPTQLKELRHAYR